MSSEFDDFVAKRCEGELLRNDEYNNLQRQALEALKKNDIEKYSECDILLEGVVQRVSYIRGMKDMEKFMR